MTALVDTRESGRIAPARAVHLNTLFRAKQSLDSGDFFTPDADAASYRNRTHGTPTAMNAAKKISPKIPPSRQ